MMRKNTRNNRILSAILAVVLLFGVLPLSAFSVDGDAPAPSEDLELYITSDGERVDHVCFARSEKVTVVAEGLVEGPVYQWQIKLPAEDTWIDIFGHDDVTMTLSYPMLRNMMDSDNRATVRCVAYLNGLDMFYTDPLTIEINADPAPEAVEPVAEIPAPVQTHSVRAGEIVTIRIEYYYRDRNKTVQAEQIWDPYVASIQAGKNFSTTVYNRFVPGRKPVLANDNPPGATLVESDATSYVKIELANVTEDITYKVYYDEIMVPYYARYFLQNVGNDLYTENAGLYKDFKGYPQDEPTEAQINQEIVGFTSLFHQPDLIAADGSTVFEVYYDRNYYLINFNLDGGFGTEPVYARYETPFAVAQPEKPGYVFKGWDLISVNGEKVPHGDEDNDGEIAGDELDTRPDKIPAENRTYQAVWDTIETTYSIAYWIVNDDGSTSFLGSRTAGAESGYTVSGEHDLDNGYAICGSEEHTHADDCYICGFDEHKHTFDCFGIDRDKDGNDPGYAGKAVIAAVNDGKTNPESGYIYVIETNSGTLWPKLYLDGYYYTINGIGAGNTPATQDQVNTIIEGNALGTGTYDNLTATKYRPKTSCNKISHTHDYTCRICEEHTHSENCYQNERYLEPVESITVKDKDGKDVTYKTDTDVLVNGDGSSVVNVYYKYKTFIIRYVYARSKIDADEYYVSTSTLNGTLEGVVWESVGNTLPEFADPDSGTTPKYFDRGDYRYYYISVTGRYEEDISNKWPAMNDVKITYKNKTFTWGSWAAEVGTEYRANIGEHANVVGSYPSLSAEMISSDPEQLEENTYVAQNMIAWWSTGTQIGPHAYHNYFEALSKDIPTDTEEISTDPRNPTEYNSNFFIKKSVSGEEKIYMLQNDQFMANHDGWTHVAAFEFVGFEWIDLNEDLRDSTKFNNYGKCSICSTACNYCNVFYFDRTIHSLKFWNYTGWLGEGKGAGNTQEGGGVKYGTSLSVFGTYVDKEFMENPENKNYPKNLEKDAYVFENWYRTSKFLLGTEVDWENTTMPDSDVTVYAKWIPVTHDVRFYLSYDAAVEAQKLGYTTVPYIAVLGTDHGECMETVIDIPTHKDPQYRFVGWFYMDNGVKTAFDPAEMTVQQDMDIFAEWATSITTQYTISYVKDQGGTSLSEDTEGHIFVGTTKTFTAKPRDDLEKLTDSEREFLWLPHTNSHSILMKELAENNTFTFRYSAQEFAPYTVRYVDAETGDEVHVAKEVPDNKQAVVTERFVYVPGYTTPPFNQTLVLSANPDENVIIFYYTKNPPGADEQVAYLVTHYTEKLRENDSDKEDYSEYTSNSYLAKLGDTVSATDLPIPGFTYYPTHPEGREEAVVGEKGAELKFYYKRNAYPYIVKYVDRTTGNVLTFKDDNGNEAAYKLITGVPYEKVVTEHAISITGFNLYSKPTQTLKIGVENGSTAADITKNVITFYYEPKQITIEYKLLCTVQTDVPFGYVSQSQEIKNSLNEISGSDAWAAEGFAFKGWYQDEAHTDPVPEGWVDANGYLRPQITEGDLANDKYAYTYYALFEPVQESLTISKTDGVTGEEKLGTDTFLFQVTGTDVLGNKVDLIVSVQGEGSVTITDLYCGTYTVTELTDWSWAYDGKTDPQTATLTTSDTVDNYTVTFTNSPINEVDWLHGESEAKENQFEIHGP